MESVSNLLVNHISPSSGDNHLLSLKRLISPLKPTWVISMLLSLLQLAKRGSQFVGAEEAGERIKGVLSLPSLKMTPLVHFEGNGSCLEVPILTL